MYGHIQKLAEAEKRGIEAAGGTADVYQYGPHPAVKNIKKRGGENHDNRKGSNVLATPMVANMLASPRIAETLSQEVLDKMHAPSKSSYPIAEPDTLLKYDAVLLGIPTRYGNFPAQWKTFWDKTGGIWVSGGFWGKYVGLFVSSGTPGGGQESTNIAAMSTLAHHGFIYVPLGYKTVMPMLANLSEVRGGSAWGAGTFAVSRSPSLHI